MQQAGRPAAGGSGGAAAAPGLAAAALAGALADPDTGVAAEASAALAAAGGVEGGAPWILVLLVTQSARRCGRFSSMSLRLAGIPVGGCCSEDMLSHWATAGFGRCAGLALLLSPDGARPQLQRALADRSATVRLRALALLAALAARGAGTSAAVRGSGPARHGCSQASSSA